MMKLRDMIKTVKKKPMPVTEKIDYPEDKYPWGLRINLGNEELDKLDIDISKMSTDDYMKIECVAYVENVRHNRRRKGPDDRNLELQIIKMNLKKTKKP